MATTRRSAASARARGRRALAPSVLFLFFAAASTVIGLPGVADADPTTDVGVDTNPAGAHVELDRDLSWVESGKAGTGGTANGPSCRRRWVTPPSPFLTDPALLGQGPVLPAPPTPGATAYYVFCGDRYVALIWAVPSQFNGGNRAGALRSLAERLVRDLPFPQAAVEVSPGERGLTGLESWFWVSGYDGTPLVDTVSGAGTTVTVEARPAAARWSFGDDSEVVGGLGRPYPARSDVTHVYERRSDRDGFPVNVTFDFETRYRVDGGEWQALAPVTRDAQRAYVVDEVRAQLVRSD